jgi:hypothetical protein
MTAAAAAHVAAGTAVIDRQQWPITVGLRQGPACSYCWHHAAAAGQCRQLPKTCRLHMAAGACVAGPIIGSV